MKNDRKKRSKAAVSSKTGTLVTAACMMLLMLGAAGVFAFSGKTIQTTDIKDTQAEQTTTAVQSEAAEQTEAAQDTYTATNQIKWHKAGIGEYNVANAKQTVTTTAQTTTADESSEQAQPTVSTSTNAAATTTTTTKATTTTTTTKATTTTTKATTAKPVTTTTKATTKAVTTTTPAVKTIYNSPKIKYTDEEFEMMCYVVQAEAGGSAECYKIAIANVIINRVKSSRFAYANNIKAVLTAPNQFTCITNYYNKTKKPTQNTIDCCKRALGGEDNSNGALYYYSPKYVGSSVAAWFESMKLCVAFENARFFKP